jgi:signal transduction histidine kinase
VSYALLAVVSAALVPALVLTTLHGESRPGPGGPLPLWGAAAGLLGLAAVLALGLGRGLRRDVATLSLTAKRLSEARLDQQVRLLAVAPRAATAEVDVLQRALFDLIDRARRMQVEIFLATERTIEARRAKSQHLAATSHDLRNALSPVLGFTDLLAGGYEGELPLAGQLRLQRMQRQGRRLLRILSEILDTAKIESQTIDLHPRECSPAELLAQAVSEVRRLRSVDVLPMRLEIAPDLPLLAVDPVRFPQALSYLCGHVIDSLDAEAEAIADGGLPALGELLLRAYQLPSGSAVVFEVAYLPEGDRSGGPGPRATPGPALGTTGLGLALPLARRLLALHGGSIAVIADVFPRLRATVPLLPRSR